MKIKSLTITIDNFTGENLSELPDHTVAAILKRLSLKIKRSDIKNVDEHLRDFDRNVVGSVAIVYEENKSEG